MGVIHEAYIQVTKEKALKACAKKVIEKLESAGLIIDDEQRGQIIDCIVCEKFEKLPTRFKSCSNEATNINFEDCDNSDLREAMKESNENIFNVQALIDIGRDLSLTYCDALDVDWESIYKERFEEQKVLEDEISDIWGTSIACLDKMLFLLIESGNSNVDDLNEEPHEKREKNSAINRVLWLFHARMCQLLHEIVQLIKSGYADGALSRWRTMHEVVVTTLFIVENGEKAAQRYLDHEPAETLKEMRIYEKHCKTLGMKHLDPREIKAVELAVHELDEKYGSEFHENYGWAASYLNKKKPSFADIEKSIDYEHMRGYYKLASNGIHANTKGVAFRLSQPSNTDMLIAGPSVFGLSDPIMRTAYSVSLFQTAISTAWNYLDNLVTTYMMENLLNRISEELTRIEDGLSEENHE